MKNIHVLPTDKPSRLKQNKITKKISLVNKGIDLTAYTPINIYITSPNEDINENDYIITKDGRLVQVSYLLSKDLEEASKVILTTDQDLIADGVQVIDDEFLEWFVKNPSCEEVGFSTYHVKGDISGKLHYQIIIPKEEPTIEEEYLKDELKKYDGIDVVVLNKLEEPKQETLEEAATNYLHSVADGKRYTGYADEDFINGAKWQADKVFYDDAIQTLEKALAILLKRQESMYSEKEVELIANEMVNWAIDNVGNPNPHSGRKFDEVISKFKKK